eukprot:m.269046 g.269046  ORF g.269046 m.269046 type:complete len:370 (-) comp81924_c0_seq1:304-1413(-)
MLSTRAIAVASALFVLVLCTQLEISAAVCAVEGICNATSATCCNATQACDDVSCVDDCPSLHVVDRHFVYGRQCVALQTCGNNIEFCLECNVTSGTCTRCQLGFALQLGGLTCINLTSTTCEYGTNATLSLSEQVPVFSAKCDPAPAARQTASPIPSTTRPPIASPTSAPQASPVSSPQGSTPDSNVGGSGLSMLAIIVMAVVGGVTVILCLAVLIYFLAHNCRTCCCCRREPPPKYGEDIEMNKVNSKAPKILTLKHSGGDTSDYPTADTETTPNTGLKGIEAEEFFKWLATLKKHKATFSILLKEMTSRRDSQTTVADRQRYTKVVTDLSRLLHLFKQKRVDMVAPIDGMELLDWAEKTVNKFQGQI